MESRKYSLLLFDLDDTLLHSSWFENGIIQTLGLHPLSVTLEKNKFIEHMLHVPQSLLDMFKEGELTTREFTRARWRSAFSHFDVSPKTELIDEMLISLFTELRKRYKLGIVTNGIYDPK
ncbi:HAD hydrolase-like protein [Paenibacillus terrigena]|uniref:HAD hydrolase-like protein n=1 Tax=Paenibacillus terrigena TaxID=369333 RepID=UPI000361E7B4|nr:HAD hydrolase-like protein [Paenibacillus terrigena]